MTIQLFPDDPKFSSTNWVPMNRDPSVWDTEITSKVQKLIPGKSSDVSILWNSQEKNKGYGLGSAVVVNKTSKSKFVIPIIIKEYKLAPLDVMITPTKAMRLNEDNVEEALFSGGIGNMSSRDRGQLLGGGFDGSGPMDMTDYTRTDQIYQKSSSADMMMAYVNQDWETLKQASGSKLKAPFTDWIDAWSDEAGLERMRTAFQDGGILNKFSGDKSIYVEFLDDINADQVRKDRDKDYRKYARNKDIMPPGRKIEVVKKVGPGAYAMLSNSISNFEPAMDLQSGREVRMILTSQLKNDGTVDAVIGALEAAGSTGVNIPWPKDDDDVKVGSEDSPKGDTYGIYEARDMEDRPIKGVMFERIMDINGDIKKRKIFLTTLGGGKQDASFKPSVVPMAETTLYCEDVLPVSDVPRAGEHGYLILKDLLIGPFDALSVAKDGWGDNEYSANMASENGNVSRVSTSDYIQGVSTGTDGMRISNKFKWVSVPDEKKFKTKSITEKQASVHYNNGTYNLRGFNVSPEWAVNLKEAEAKFVLASHGMGINKIAQAMGSARHNGQVGLIGLTGIYETQKKASIDDEAWAKFSYSFDHSQHEFVKCAAMFDRLDTVDKVLGLNFINKSNIARFTSAIPLFQDTFEELVRLLIVARIGATEIPEEAVAQSIDSLGEVISGLETLSLHSTDEDPT